MRGKYPVYPYMRECSLPNFAPMPGARGALRGSKRECRANQDRAPRPATASLPRGHRAHVSRDGRAPSGAPGQSSRAGGQREARGHLVAEVRAGLLRSASRSARAAVRRPARSWRWPDWAIPCLYLLGAAALTWRMWANPAGTVPTNGGPKVGSDIYLNVWFMRYTATALSHGQLP